VPKKTPPKRGSGLSFQAVGFGVRGYASAVLLPLCPAGLVRIAGLSRLSPAYVCGAGFYRRRVSGLAVFVGAHHRA